MKRDNKGKVYILYKDDDAVYTSPVVDSWPEMVEDFKTTDNEIGLLKGENLVDSPYKWAVQYL